MRYDRADRSSESNTHCKQICTQELWLRRHAIFIICAMNDGIVQLKISVFKHKHHIATEMKSSERQAPRSHVREDLSRKKNIVKGTLPAVQVLTLMRTINAQYISIDTTVVCAFGTYR